MIHRRGELHAAEVSNFAYISEMFTCSLSPSTLFNPFRNIFRDESIIIESLRLLLIWSMFDLSLLGCDVLQEIFVTQATLDLVHV